MGLFRLIRYSFYIVFIIGLGIGYFVYIEALSKPLHNRELTVVVPKGAGVAWLANHLEQQEIIDNRYIFRLFSWFNYRNTTIKAGEYTLVDVNSIPELLDKIVHGKVIQYAITLVEGRTYKEFLQQLKQQKRLRDELQDLSDREIMRAVGAPGRHPEGQFAPQTYFYEQGISDLDLLKIAHQTQMQIVEQAWAQRSDDLQLDTPYELLIMASIIEKETGAAHEREEISGVFNNRLKSGIKLQTDPTVIYGMGDQYQGNIRRRDLTTDTPYNTYTRYGLPPTPIALPGEAAIFAAANPALTEAYYFVGKGDGTHQFSKTLKEHNAAVIKYQLGGRAKPFSSYNGENDD